MPYMDFIELVEDASLALTDSGGLQEETTALGVPCFTLRENTERTVTIDVGTNTLVGANKSSIISAYEAFRNNGPKTGRIPELWDGKAAERIVNILLRKLNDCKRTTVTGVSKRSFDVRGEAASMPGPASPGC